LRKLRLKGLLLHLSGKVLPSVLPPAHYLDLSRTKWEHCLAPPAGLPHVWSWRAP